MRDLKTRPTRRSGAATRTRAAVRIALFAALACLAFAAPALRAEIVINEIHYHARSELGEDEFIELFNTDVNAFDISGWALTDGVGFRFPAGTIIPGNGYLVVASDADHIRAKYGLDPALVIGNYTGFLSNGGERVELSDDTETTIDVVNYLDEYPWPEAADGDGPSLECLDPYRDNFPSRNWLSSANTGWVRIAVTGRATSNRFYVYLEGAGECLIDDIRISESGSNKNLLPAGDFESGDAGWTATGTHSGSRLTSSDTHSGDAAIRIVATGTGSGSAASFQRELDFLVVGENYDLEFWAKSLTGNASLIDRLPGGGLLARTDLRGNEGTPGRENSTRRDDLPPLISIFSSSPKLPRPGEAVTLLADVVDENLAAVTATYDTGNGPREIVLRDDGNSGDESAGDGLFTGTIPAVAIGTIVEYQIMAVDAGGQPVETPLRRYAAADFDIDSDLPVYQIFVRDSEWQRLNADIWSENYVAAVLIHDGEVYSAGLRYRGGRPRLFRKKSLKLRFDGDHLFRERKKLNLNACAMDDDYITEPLAYQLYEQVGMATAETRFVRVQLNGEFHGLFIDVEQVDKRFLKKRGLDPDGALYKAVGIVSSLRRLEGVRYNGQEFSYQSQYEKKTREEEPYDDLIGFIEGLYTTPPAEREAYLEANFEVESFISYLAVSNLMCIWDNIQHNFYIYRDTEGNGKWRIIPWDNDHAWGEWEWRYYWNSTYHLLMGTRAHAFAGVWYTWNGLWTELLAVPSFRERYFERMRELLNTRYAEGPIFAQAEAYRDSIASTVALDEAKWPDSLEPLHTGPRRTMAQEIPLLLENITRRRRYVATQLDVELIDVPAGAIFLRGDSNGDGGVDIADASSLLNWLFLGQADPPCLAAADPNGSGVVDLADAVYTLNYLFLGGSDPVAPFPACGPLPNNEPLPCETSTSGSCEF